MGINDPDWGRYKVTAGQQLAPVGDPNRWGATTQQLLAASFVSLTTDQFIQVSTNDRYSRSWSINGSVTLPDATWVQMALPGAFPMGVMLEVTQGVGQATVMHRIALAMGDAFGGVQPLGLCNQQDYVYGGPYVAVYEGVGAATKRTKAFSAIGALIGHALQVRVFWLGGTGEGLPGVCSVSAIVTPYAAGQGL
jgi:hypothetical protein